MTWLLLWGWLRKGLGALLSIVARYPWQAALIVALVACGWLWRGKERAIDQRDAWHTAWTKQKRASDLAEVAQRAENQRIADAYKGASDNAERNHVAALADAGDRTAAFIARSRVRACPSSSGDGHPATQASGAAVPESPAASAVVVDKSDVMICGDLYAYSLSAHRWAQDLIAKGLAEPAK